MSENELYQMLTSGPGKVHLVGVAGSGMSGIAALLLSLGKRVSGCDRVTTLEVERLQGMGLDFHSVQDGSYLSDVDVVVHSSAIRSGNPAYDEAARLGRPMILRAKALAAILETKKGIIVAGMHGKTTTSALAAHVLRAGGLRPSHYVGAEIPILGTNAHWDEVGEYFVAEGDESDGTLRLYHPEHAIVLNIEEEHLDYYKDLEAIEAVFRQLLEQTRGTIFYCADDPHATRMCSTRPRAVSYGTLAPADYSCRNLRAVEFRSVFEVVVRGESMGEAVLGIPGEHNVRNALGVVALAMELGVAFERIVPALASFRGARRRFEIKHAGPHAMVVDDYAHHPTELRVTLATAKEGSNRRVVAMFQPHRYSRTVALKAQFGSAFGDADAVCITDIYPASELPIEGVSGKSVADAISAAGHPEVHYEPTLARLHLTVGNLLQPGDILLSLGAGNIHEAASRLSVDLEILEALRERMGTGMAKLYEPLSRHTTLRVGGPAQFWLEPETEEGFARVIRYCRDAKISLMVIGRGSNLLVRDGGIRGVVVHLARGEFGRVAVSGMEITAGVGVKFRQVSAAAKAAGLGGFEWMEGIPGNTGGGIRMNAGAMGIETFDQVVEVRCLDGDGLAHSVTPGEIEVGYRSVPWFRDHYALSARLHGYPSTIEEISKRIAESLEKRRRTQPAAASAGCMFKNPEACPAGKLIEEFGLKNFRVGGARISDVHANFIVNDGGATCADVITIIETVRGTALKERGISMETEVQIVGEEANF